MNPTLRLTQTFHLFAILAICGMSLGCGPEAPASDPAPSADPATDPTTDPAPATDEMAALPEIPLGLPKLEIPDNNPMTAEKVELGKLLYFDKRLSKDGTISCATCHDPTMGWAEEDVTSIGIKEQVGTRNSPTVINSAYATSQFWDGREPTLEAQALGPIENPIEMGHSLPELVKELNEIAGYKERFQKVFGTDVTSDGIAKAIAAFERTVLSGNSAWDKYQAGDKTALNEQEIRGMELFNQAECATCHAPPVFSNFRFYNAGVGSDLAEPDSGRQQATDNERDFGKFRVPTLRDITDTGPYFHNGSEASLEEAVRLMATGGVDNPKLSALFRGLQGREYTDEQIADLVAFLGALSGEYPVIEEPELP